MYQYVGSYMYRGKRPLARTVACKLVIEALEGILASLTEISAGEVHEEAEED
jgi:hypothetical protein